MKKINLGILGSILAGLLTVSPTLAAVGALQGTSLDIQGITDGDAVITFYTNASEIRQGGDFEINTGDKLKLIAGKGKGVVVEHNNLQFNNGAADLAKYGDPKIDFKQAGALITAESNSLNLETDDDIKLIGDMVRIDHNLLKFVNDTKYPTPTIDFVREGAKITANDGVRIEGDKGLTVDDDFTVGGTIALNGALTLGDGADTVVVNSSDWDVSATGDMTGVGAITADGLITGTLGAVISGALSSINASSNFATNINTGTSTGAVTIGGGTATQTVAINSADWDISTTGVMTGIGAITADGLITGSLGTTISGAVVSLNDNSNFNVTVGTGTSTGDISIGGGTAGQSVAINSEDWDISATGDMTGIGAITSNGLITGSLGTTITGAVASLNASSNFATNINTGTSTGAVTIGGAAGNTINVGTDNTVADTIAVGSALDNVAITGDDWSITNAGVANFVSVGATTPGTGAFTTLASTGVTTIGNDSATVAIDSNDWNINATGDMTGIGAITANGLITGSLGATLSGAVLSLNDNSNFNVTVGTGTSTGDISIGGGTAGQSVAINSEDWDIGATGDMTGIGAITADGAIGFTGAITLGNGTSTVAVATTSWDVSTGGAMTNLTGVSLASGDFAQTGAGTFGTGTGAVSLNGDVAIAAGKNLAFTSGAGTSTQTFTGTTTTADTITAASLTTGKALSISATNTHTANAAVNPITLALTNAQATTANDSYVGVGLNFTNNPTIAANTEYAMRVQNQVTANATDNAVAALLVLDNADTADTGSTVVTDGLRIANSGAIAGGITNAINIASTTVTNDIVLQNGESLDNNVDNQVNLNLGTTGTLLLTGGSNITTDQTTFNLLNTVATTLNIGGAATTALNIGNGAGPYTDISIGSGAGAHTAINIAGTGAIGADTINIGTGGTAADVIHIGDAAVASTITIGNAAATTVSITDDNWSVTAAGVGTFASGSIIGGTTITTKAGAATGDNCTRIGDMVVDYTNGKLYIATVVATPCTWVVVGTQT